MMPTFLNERDITKTRRMGILTITSELLDYMVQTPGDYDPKEVEDVLKRFGFPQDMVIHRCRMSFERQGDVEFVIEQKDLKEVSQGQCLPTISAMIRSTINDDGTVTQHFDDWIQL